MEEGIVYPAHARAEPAQAAYGTPPNDSSRRTDKSHRVSRWRWSANCVTQLVKSSTIRLSATSTSLAETRQRVTNIALATVAQADLC